MWLDEVVREQLRDVASRLRVVVLEEIWNSLIWTSGRERMALELEITGSTRMRERIGR
jgi:hypothetical protein